MKSETKSFCDNQAHGEDAHLSLEQETSSIDLVLDGVSMSNGKIASSFIKDAFSKTSMQTPGDVSRFLRKASKELYQKEQGRALTTATIAITNEQKLTVLNVGDSPAYLIRKGGSIRSMARMDKLPDEPAAITQAVGEARITIHKKQATIKQGDTLVLMSDGVSDNLSKERIAKAIKNGEDLAALLQACKERNEGAVFGEYKEDDATLITRKFY